MVLLTLALVEFVPWWPAGRRVVIGDWVAVDGLPNSLGAVRIDWSYILALPEIQRQGLQYGPQIAFTYGPLGLFHTENVPGPLLALALVSRGVLALVFALACRRLLEGVRVRSAGVRAAIVAAMLVVWLIVADGRHEIYWLAFSILLATFSFTDERDRRRPSPLVIALAGCAAYASLVKFSFAVVAITLIALVALHDGFRRRIPVTPLIYVGAVLALWVAAGQRLTNLPEWVRTSVELATTYSDAMAKGFVAPYTLADVALFLVAGLLPFLAAAYSARREASSLLLLLGFFLVFFVQSKHAWGGNQLEDATTSLLFLVVVYAATVPFASLQRRRAAATATALLLGAAACAGILYRYDAWAHTLLTRPWDAGVYLELKATDAGRIVTGRAEPNLDGVDRIRKRIRELAQLPQLSGTVDAFPDYAAVPVSLTKVVYRPRPMFLSINAQTHRLLRANAQFFRSPQAPGTVLFEIFVYPALPHDRYPATADGPSWLELLARYRVDATTKDFVILKRGRAVPYELKPLSERKIQFNERIPVPEARHGLVWAKVDIQRSLRGYLLNALYKLPPITLTVERDKSPAQSFRLVPEMAREGFLLSPLVTSNADFVLLSQARRGHDLSSSIGKVSHLTLSTSKPLASVFRKPIGLRFFRLRFATPSAASPLPLEVRRLLSLKRIQDGFERGIFPPRLSATGEGGRTVLLAHAPSRSVVAIPRASDSVRIRYGFEETSWRDPKGRTDGSKFRVSAVIGHTTVSLWQQFVNPVTSPDKRGELTVRVKIPRGARRLVLETLPGPKGEVAYDHVYWAGLDFRRAVKILRLRNTSNETSTLDLLR